MKLSFREKLSFGVGAFSKDIFSVVTVSYLMVFYTDVFGLTASLAGLVLLITKLIDAVSNPILGAVMDRTYTRWGRFRPYIAFATLPFACATVAVFFVPDLPLPLKFLYALVTYNLAGLCFTCIDVAIWGMVPSLTKRLDERSQLIASGRAFSNIAGMIVAPLVLPFVVLMGDGDDQRGYLWLGVTVAVLGSLFALLLVSNVKERHVQRNDTPLKMSHYLALLKHNPGVCCVIVCMLSFGLGVGLQNSAGIYYIKYYLLRADLVPTYIFTSYTFKVVGAFLAPFFIVKFKLGNRLTAALAFTVLGIASLSMWFLPIRQVELYMCLAALASTGIGGLLVSITGLMAEMADRVEQQTQQRADGVLFSFNALSMQAGFALSAAFAGVLMDAFGYVPNSLAQTTDALAAIKGIRCLGPALICLMGLLAVKAYAGNSAARSGLPHSPRA